MDKRFNGILDVEIKNCFIKVKKGDTFIEDGPAYVKLHLDGYAIIPMDDYDELQDLIEEHKELMLKE